MDSTARSRRVSPRQVLVSLAIMIGAVLNSGIDGCNPIQASSETVIESFSLEGPTTAIVGDTLYMSIVATSPGSIENVFKMVPTWSSGAPVASIISQGSSSTRDIASYRAIAVGNGVITASATKGKLTSGGTPTASKDVRVVGLPVRVRWQNVPATLRVGESVNAGAMLESANGDRYRTTGLPVLVIANAGGLVQMEGIQDVMKLTGLAPGAVTVSAFLAPFDMQRYGLSGPQFRDEASFTIIGPAQSLTFAPPNGQLLVSQTMSVTAVAADALQTLVPGVTLEVTSLTPTIASATLTGANSFSVTALSTGGASQATARIRVTARDGAFATLVREYEVVVGGRVSSVTVVPGSSRLAIQQQLALSASVALLPGSPGSPAPTVQWESSSLTKVSVNAQGVALALGNTGATPATITAIAEGVRSNAATVQVGPIGMRMVDATFSGKVGSTRTFTLQELNANGTPIVGALVSAADVDWLSSNSSVVTVDAQGLATCAALGTAVVNATLRGTSVSAAATVICSTIGNDNPVAGMELDPIELTVPLGQVAVYQARLLDAQGEETAPAAGFQVVYAASSSAIAELANGPTSGRFTTKAAGSTGVIAYYMPISGGTPIRSASAFLRVGNTTAGSVANVRITTTHLLGFVGLSFGFTAVAIDGAGNTMTGVNFRWFSSNPTAVGVNIGTGMASALSAGGAMITASAVLPNDDSGPTGVAFMTVRPRGALVGDINLAGSVPAAGATLRAYQGGAVMGVGVVPVANASPGRAYIPGLAAGSYTVTVSLPGHAVRTFSNVVVTAESITQLNGGAAIVLVPQP